MFNPLLAYPAGPESPAMRVVPVIPSDTVDLVEGLCRGLLVGTGGTANLIDGSGASRSDVPLMAGYNPIRTTRILTGGTATNIWALY